MRKLVATVVMATLLIFTNSCGLLKHKTVDRSLQESEIKNDVDLHKSILDSTVDEQRHVNETSSAVLNEEITIKTPVDNSIELTAKFRIDTSASLKGDTALKLVDINNDNVSITIFQNKKTNELMAKVRTGNKTKTTSFSEMQIKRNYASTTSKSDSTRTTSVFSKKIIDSTDRSEKKTKSVVLHREKTEEAKSSIWTYIIIASVAIFLFFLYRATKKYFLHF